VPSIRVFNENFQEIGRIERRTVSELLYIGRRLQADFGAYWQLDFALEGVYATCLI
jgi:hypothetical protein